MVVIHQYIYILRTLTWGYHMDLPQAMNRSGIARRYEYDTQTVLALDTGVPDEAIDVDVVDNTAIVVLNADEVVEREFELPEGTADVFINNGILTIEVNQ